MTDNDPSLSAAVQRYLDEEICFAAESMSLIECVINLGGTASRDNVVLNVW